MFLNYCVKSNKQGDHDLKNLANWFKAYEISLNVDRTKLALFTSPRKQLESDLKIKTNEKKSLWNRFNKTFGNPNWNKKTQCVITIAMICSNLASLWKFQYFRWPIYNPVDHLWWSFYCKNSKPFIFTKKLHHRCLLGF